MAARAVAEFDADTSKMSAELSRVSRQAENAGDKSLQRFNDVLGKVGGIAAIVGTVTRGWEEYNSALDQTIQKMNTITREVGKIAAGAGTRQFQINEPITEAGKRGILTREELARAVYAYQQQDPTASPGSLAIAARSAQLAANARFDAMQVSGLAGQIAGGGFDTETSFNLASYLSARAGGEAGIAGNLVEFAGPLGQEGVKKVMALAIAAANKAGPRGLKRLGPVIQKYVASGGKVPLETLIPTVGIPGLSEEYRPDILEGASTFLDFAMEAALQDQDYGRFLTARTRINAANIEKETSLERSAMVKEVKDAEIDAFKASSPLGLAYLYPNILFRAFMSDTITPASGENVGGGFSTRDTAFDLMERAFKRATTKPATFNDSKFDQPTVGKGY